MHKPLPIVNPNVKLTTPLTCSSLQPCKRKRQDLTPTYTLKEVVEMPDHQADRILRSIEQNNAELSNVLLKQMPVLGEPGVWSEIVESVSKAFQADAPENNHILDRYHPSRPAGTSS